MNFILYSVIAALPLVLTGCGSATENAPAILNGQLLLTSVGAPHEYTIQNSSLSPPYNQNTTINANQTETIVLPVATGYTITSDLSTSPSFSINITTPTNVSYDGTTWTIS